MSEGVRCMWMRGGTSKGGYFISDDLPENIQARDEFLLRAMGSPDLRQIDGMGGADPLTSKVAVVKKSNRSKIDVDYLFLQVSVDQALVSDAQNCGNILAGVGPFAIDRGLVEAGIEETDVSIFMENTGQTAVARIQTPHGAIQETGEASIDGVPSTAAPITLTFKDTAGSSCGALLPSGNARDLVSGIEVTMIDAGMPCVLLRAEDMGVSGQEAPRELEIDSELRAKLEELRLRCGSLMNLGDVRDKTVPKMTLVSYPKCGVSVSTRTVIPHKCHKSIGVLGAVSVATACLIPDSIAFDLANRGNGSKRYLPIEHPSGETTVIVAIDDFHTVTEAAILRTARKLMDGKIFA
ncbi:MAG: 4-oxalomesaconate tautomerase [Rhodobacteraceae bacterium]|nr:4-oxalomesaconate tautomerase [Paracoccaceae bacterium]